MAYSYDNFNSVGATVCNLTYPFLLRAHIKVYKARDLLAGTGTLLSETTHYTWTGASQITLGTAIASGEVVTVERQTPNTAQLSPWTDGSNLTAEALNNADLQNLYVVQEQQDKNDLGAAKSISASNTATTASNDSTTAVNTANAALPKAGGSMTGAIAMGTNKITGLGDPTAAQDAVTKAYLERTGSIQSAQIQDGTLVNDDVNASAAIAQSKLDIANATTSASGYMSAADKTKLDSCDTGAKDDQTAAEIKTLVGQATDSNVYTDAEKTKLAGCDTGAKDDQTASEIKALYEDSGNNNASYIKTQYESNAQTNPLTDAEKSVIDGVTANTSELNKLDGVTASTTELNIVAGKSFRASTDGALSTTSDTEMPSSKVVANHVAAQIGTVGGFTTIANDASFPATASQPATGVIISISDAQGVAVSGTTSTTGRTVDGTPATVTINNFPSSLTGETLASGVGLLVTSTGSGNIYNYHKLLAAESDVKQLSDDINDFNARYRIASSAPGSNNDDGDLWFDTSAKKMKVYNGTTGVYDDVASVGNFFINTLSSSSGSGGGSATFNGTATRFTLSNPPTMAQQLIVSVNGVVQRPNSGTSPSEGFAISGNDIIFSAAPASGSDFFIITQGSSVSIGTPSDNTVTAGKIVDGEIGNAKISNSANIAGSKVADDSIPEVKLDIHNAPATDKYLKYTSNGMEWSDGASEGTDVKSTGESGTTKFLRVDGDGTCSWQVPPDTVYTHPNHSGEVTSSADGAQTIASNVVDEDNLKVSNSPTNGQFLSAQSGNTGGLTWATVEAAPSFTATANLAITAEDAVIMQADGKVAKCFVHPTATGSLASIDSLNSEFMTAYDKVSGKVAFLARESSGCSLRVATVATGSGTTLTFGTKVTVTTGSGEPLGFAFNNNTIVVLYRKSSDCQAVAATVSGTTITLGSETEIDSNDSYEQSVVYDSTSDRWVLFWFTSGASNYRVAAVSGTTFTLGTTGSSITTNTHGYFLKALEAKSKGRILLSWIKSSNTSDPFMRVGQVNGGSTNTVTWGAETAMMNENVYNHRTAIGWDDTNDRGLFAWHRVADWRLDCRGFGINTSDNSLTLGGTGNVTSSTTKYIDIVQNVDAGQFRIYFIKDGSSPHGRIQDKPITVNSSFNVSIGNGEEIGDSVNNSGYFNGGGRMCEYVGNSGILVCWRDNSGGGVDGKRYRIRKYGGGNLSSTEPFIGFAAGTVSDGQNCVVKVVGNTATKSSLTPGRDYYVQSDGSISIGTSGTHRAGIAISTTKLLIKG